MVALQTSGSRLPAPPPPQKIPGSDEQTNDATQESRGCEGAMTRGGSVGGAGQAPTLAWSGLSKGEVSAFVFTVTGVGPECGFHMQPGFVWFELPLWYKKGRRVHTFLSACPGVGQKGKRAVGFESCQSSDVTSGARLSIAAKFCLEATLSCPPPVQWRNIFLER